MSETYPSRSRSRSTSAAASGECSSSTRIDRLVGPPPPLVGRRERDREHGFVELVRGEPGDVGIRDRPRGDAHLLGERRRLAGGPGGLAERPPERVSPARGGGEI